MIQTVRFAGSAFRRTLKLAWLASAFAAVLGHSAQADWQIPADASVQLSGGHVALGDTDLTISGTLALGAGSIDLARDISIHSGGLLDAGSGSLELTGTWSKAGNFLPGSSAVRFIDGGLAQSAVVGDTLFHDLGFVSSAGKIYVLAVASTQSIEGLLTILGAPGQAIQMASATADQVASISLLPSGSQNIHNVGVSDVHAIGQPLAPDESNQGGSGNDLGWFGNTGFVAGIPLLALSPRWLALLGALLVLTVLRKRSAQNL